MQVSLDLCVAGQLFRPGVTDHLLECGDFRVDVDPGKRQKQIRGDGRHRVRLSKRGRLDSSRQEQGDTKVACHG